VPLIALTHTPNFRLPSDLRNQAEEQARREGAKVSDVARKALEEHLARHRQAS
jgi:hypothetical protein